LTRRRTSAPQDPINGMARSPGAQANADGSNGAINRTSSARTEAVADSDGRSDTKKIGEDRSRQLGQSALEAFRLQWKFSRCLNTLGISYMVWKQYWHAEGRAV
jgi:hypothetical protein